MALTFSRIYLLLLGHPWSLIQEKISSKVSESIPVVIILFLYRCIDRFVDYKRYDSNVDLL